MLCSLCDHKWQYIAKHLLAIYIFYSLTSSMGRIEVLYDSYYVSVLHFYDPGNKKCGRKVFKNYPASTVPRKHIHILVGMFRAIGWLFLTTIKHKRCFFLEGSVLTFSTITNIQHDKHLFQNLLKFHDFFFFFHTNWESESGVQGLRRKLNGPLFSMK